VRASAVENPELFWAIRGGGGNFGIITAFEFTAHPTTKLFFGKIAFPASEAAAVLQGWAEYLRIAPVDLTSAVNFANPFAGGAEAPVEVYVAVDGDVPQLAARVTDPVRRLGTVIHDDVGLIPYADTLEDGAAPARWHPVRAAERIVGPESVPEVLRILSTVRTAEPLFINVRSLGGAVSRVPADATAFAHRHAELMVVIVAAGPEPVVEATRPALDRTWASLAPHVSGVYANFHASATEEDVAAIYPGPTRRRLTAIKRRYDPGNLFARNHNIRPQWASADVQWPGRHPERKAHIAR
jgi:FAD/FMN-containing dehydrogenase